jgi:hypothetical protein
MALLLILAVEPGQAVAAPDPLLSLIPRDGEVEGFVRDGAPILCYDEESLAERIDGAAPFYLERGAVAVDLEISPGFALTQDVFVAKAHRRIWTMGNGLAIQPDGGALSI